MNISTEQLGNPTRRLLSPAGWGRPNIVVATVVAAVVINEIIYAIGRALGGDFLFTNAGKSTEVTTWSVAALTTGPLLVGMTLVALLSRKWPSIIKVALVVGPALALVTIAILTIPADLDTTSTTTLALCHVALVPVVLGGLLAIARRSR
jgi:hypothetical protein